MFKIGDSVYLTDNAQEDVAGCAWKYINAHRNATIASIFFKSDKLPEDFITYAVVWSEDFLGGWDCWGLCQTHRGQLIKQSNMELNFEASREIVTVPNICKNLQVQPN